MAKIVFPPHFPLAELTRSERATQLGIANVPTPEHEANLAALATHILQPLRDALGVPIPVSSGYRSPALNGVTPNASLTSQHQLGQAADLDMKRATKPTGVTNAALFHYIRLHLPFDQLIWEFGTRKEPAWVHVSYGPKMRGDIRRAVKDPKTGKDAYPVWTP